MALLYSPPSPHGHSYYEASQLAAFALYVGLLVAQGYRRGYAWRSWLPLVAASTLALVLGCQLVFLAPGDWLAWLGGDADVVRAVAEGPRSIVGGAAFSLVAVLALRRALGFRSWAVLDAFAGPLCWALAVQSVGCVVAGCCWGEPTAAGTWGLVYGPDTPAYMGQLAQGFIQVGASHALPVVPTQLAHLLLCAGTGLALHLLRRRAAGWPGGSRYLLAMGLLCLGRFSIEFGRDVASEPLWNTPLTLAGCTLPGVQWLLLLEAAALLGSWVWVVRRAALAAAPALPTPATSAPALVGIGLLVATARLAPGTLSLPEILVLQALLLAVLLAEAYTWLLAMGHNVPRLAGLPLSLLLGGTLLLATAQAPAPQQNPPTEEDEAQHRLTFSVGTLHNQYEEHPSGGCSSSDYTYGHRTQASGGEVAYQFASGTESHLVNAVGGGAWVGTEAIAITSIKSKPYYAPVPNYLGDHQLYDVHVYANGHQNSPTGRFGFDYRFGLHIGQLGNSIIDNSDDIRHINILPEVMAAFGYRRKLFGQISSGYGAENALGNYTGRFGLGVGRPFGNNLLAGVALPFNSLNNAGSEGVSLGFVSASLRLPASTGLSALGLEPYFATNFNQHNQFSLKLSYRLGR